MKKILSIICATAFILCLLAGTQKKYAATAMKSVPTIAFTGVLAARRAAILQGLRTNFPNNIIAPSFIRVEQQLANGSQSYNFTITQLGNEVPTEKKLNQQDAFFVCEVGLFLMKELVATAGIGVLHTYPNTTDFPDEVLPGLQNAHLEHIYNGNLSIKVGDTSYLPDLPVVGCRVINTTLLSGANTKNERHPSDGFVELTPQFLIRGREANIITLNVPGNANQKVQSTGGVYNAKVVLILAGFKVTGAGNQKLPSQSI